MLPEEGTVEGRRVSTPKGLSVNWRVRAIHSDSSSGPRAAAPRMPNPPAFDTAAASSGVEAPPMPASRIGYLMPNLSHSGVCNSFSAMTRGLLVGCALQADTISE